MYAENYDTYMQKCMLQPMIDIDAKIAWKDENYCLLHFKKEVLKHLGQLLYYKTITDWLNKRHCILMIVHVKKFLV